MCVKYADTQLISSLKFTFNAVLVNQKPGICPTLLERLNVKAQYLSPAMSPLSSAPGGGGVVENDWCTCK